MPDHYVNGLMGCGAANINTDLGSALLEFTVQERVNEQSHELVNYISIKLDNSQMNIYLPNVVKL